MKTAVIFDMDGVISDTQKYHAQFESKVFKKFDIDIPPDEVTLRFAGTSDEYMLNDIFGKDEEKKEKVGEELEKKWDELPKIMNEGVIPIPHSVELIKEIKRRGLKLAVASASTIAFIQFVLRSLNIEDQFDAIASSEEVRYSKPEPDVFLLAAKRIETDPAECVVIEDGASGMKAAKRAGMKSIGLVPEKNDSWPADVLVTSLGEVTVDMIRNL